jgi:hypothetical protein
MTSGHCTRHAAQQDRVTGRAHSPEAVPAAQQVR